MEEYEEYRQLIISELQMCRNIVILDIVLKLLRKSQ